MGVQHRPLRHAGPTLLVACALLVASGAANAGAPADAYQRPGVTVRVSVGPGGTEGSATSRSPAISANGRYVAFYSFAPDLVAGDTNGVEDVFVHDSETRTTERVSVASDGTQANDGSQVVAISGDGRYVAFQSRAENLVPGDTNGRQDVFVHDREAGTTERVSVASDGTQGDGHSRWPSISADGRYVAFASWARNLVTQEVDIYRDVFVHDRQTGATELMSVDGEGAPLEGHSFLPAISADGAHVGFTFGPTGSAHIYVRDRAARTTERVSVASDGSPAIGWSFLPALSADGRYVAFNSDAANLVPNDRNEADNIFVHDRATGTTERVSVASDGAEASDSLPSHEPAISADGRYVVFHSQATNLSPGKTTSSQSDVFVHDRHTGTTEQLSVALDGSEADGSSSGAAISADGRFVAFDSSATNLTSGDGNVERDVFVRDRGPVVGVGEMSVQVDGELATVSGWATFSGQTVAAVSDPDDDGGSGAGEAGAELTGASLTYRPEEGDLLVRLDVASLPGRRCTGLVCESGGGAPGVIGSGILHDPTVYRVAFDLEDTGYEVRVRGGSAVWWRTQTVAGQPELGEDPHFALYRCDPDCEEHASLSGAIGTSGTDVRVSVPLAALGAGKVLSDLRASTHRSEGTLGPGETLDEAALADVTIPQTVVEIGVAPASTPAEGVTYTTTADLADGRFAATLDVGSPPGDHRVWARACVAAICGVKHVEVRP